jgi:hypothetical protein
MAGSSALRCTPIAQPQRAGPNAMRPTVREFSAIRAFLLDALRRTRLSARPVTSPSSRFPSAFLAAALLLLLPGALLAQVTEIPQTVAPGTFLLEMDGLSLAFDHDHAAPAGNIYRATAIGGTFISTGITSSLDVQVGLQLFYRATYETGVGRDSRSGLGDMTFRTKWTFWRNESLGAAAAIMPYIKIPSNTGGIGNNALEGGLIVPWSMDVNGLTVGAMANWAILRNDNNDGYDSNWFFSGYAQQSLTRLLNLYAETTLQVSSAGLSDWVGTIGAGAVLNLTKRLSFDYEINRGLNRRATDWVHTFRVNWEW